MAGEHLSTLLQLVELFLSGYSSLRRHEFGDAGFKAGVVHICYLQQLRTEQVHFFSLFLHFILPQTDLALEFCHLQGCV
jgi:hypothetical protein